MRRRVHVPAVITGRLTLGPAESHHLRDVLRVERATEIEVFDSTGRSAIATTVEVETEAVVVDVGLIQHSNNQIRLTIASAVPKGDRADWMVEKLSELGVSKFIPLETTRSVVLPTGRGKAERWQRIAIEAAKQSRREGVMTIEPLTKLSEAMSSAAEICVASTGPNTVPLLTLELTSSVTIFIGPEGGWTDAELEQFAARKATAVALTSTVLRIETAAVVAAALARCRI